MISDDEALIISPTNLHAKSILGNAFYFIKMISTIQSTLTSLVYVTVLFTSHDDCPINTLCDR